MFETDEPPIPGVLISGMQKLGRFQLPLSVYGIPPPT
jgi:hypothetical protein